MPDSFQIPENLNTPAWGDFGEDIYKRTYSRVKSDGTKESWADTVYRVVVGNTSFVDNRFIESGEREKLFELIYNFGLLPGGRHLWVTGVKNRNYVSNCFSSETQVLTSDGWLPIGCLSGDVRKVVTDSGAWVDAEFKSFGKQALMAVTYGRGGSEEHQVFATPDHEWVVLRQKSGGGYRRERVQTKDLKTNDRLPMVNGRNNGMYLSPQGIQHGVVYGDGTSNEHDTSVVLIGDSCVELLKWFELNRQNEATYVDCQPAVCVSGMPSRYKQLPPINENKPYLMGFLAGWLAADGSVHVSTGGVRLFNKSREVLLQAKSIASVCGFRTTEPFLERSKNPYDGSPSELYSIAFYRCDGVRKLLVRSDHLAKFDSARKPQRADTMRVRSVVETDRVEEVYCAVVPDTHTFVIKGHVLTGNCWSTGYTDDFSRHFTFAFSRLMEGGGVGSNYSNSFIKRYKLIPHKVGLHLVCDPEHRDYKNIERFLSTEYSPEWGESIQVDDSREGWVDSLRLVLDRHYNPVNGNDLVLDVSRIRPQGSRLKSFGGVASGPLALVEMLLSINSLMNTAVGKKPDCRLVLDIDHEIARCVVAGNLRRSARMSMKHWKDDDIMDFITMKADGTSHWTTNISVIIDGSFWKAIRRKDKQARKVLRAISEGMLSNGEPGIFNMTKAQEGELFEVFSSNPCGEILLPEWGSCNLGSVNLAYFANKPLADMLEAFRLMTRFLMRATFADYPDDDALKIVERDRRVGVGITGFADWQVLEGHTYSHFPNCEGQKKKLVSCADMTRKEARRYAFQLRIPEPIKVGTAAPTGSTSKLCGISEGIQPVLFKYFKRRVNFSIGDPEQAQLVDRLAADGNDVEDSMYTPDTKVVSYYCKVGVLSKPGVDEKLIEDSTEISLEECLAVQKTLQDIYADNSISFTINVDPQTVTVKELERALVAFGPDLKGTTVFPTVNNRPQMPYERIDVETFNKAKKKHTFTGEMECKNGVCMLPGKASDDDV